VSRAHHVARRIAHVPGAVVWFTGLPASGKSTLAERARRHLADEDGRAVALLDSDVVRDVLGSAGYDPAGRDTFYDTLANLAGMLAFQGLIVLVAATAPLRMHRDVARLRAPRFIEVWVDTPLAECEARDPKGLYAHAHDDPANQLPGVGAAYEPPAAPDVIAEGGDDDVAIMAIECMLDQ